MKKKQIILIISLLMFTVTGITEEVERMISLLPSVTEEIYLLHVEDRLVANTIYCVRPEKAREKEKVGTIIDVNIEIKTGFIV